MGAGFTALGKRRFGRLYPSLKPYLGAIESEGPTFAHPVSLVSSGKNRLKRSHNRSVELTLDSLC